MIKLKPAKKIAHDMWLNMPNNPTEQKSLFEHVINQCRQQQHEATWAMAMEAALERVRDVWRQDSHKEQMIRKDIASSINAMPCPPLQTTNEK